LLLFDRDTHRALKLYDVMADYDVKNVMPPEGTSHKQKAPQKSPF
jgi:hypothetical protein